MESVLVSQGYLSPGELDPLNRRLVADPKPDIVVQGQYDWSGLAGSAQAVV